MKINFLIAKLLKKDTHLCSRSGIKLIRHMGPDPSLSEGNQTHIVCLFRRNTVSHSYRLFRLRGDKVHSQSLLLTLSCYVNKAVFSSTNSGTMKYS